MPSVTLSRVAGTARLCLKHLPRARARATKRSNVLFNLCTNLRGPSKTSWSNNLESRLEVRCWLGWSSIVPIFSYSSTSVSRTTVTQPALPSFGECVDYRKRTRHKLDSRWSRGVFKGAWVKTTERIVMDDAGTFVEAMLIIPQLPDVELAPTKTYHSDNKGARNVYIRNKDLEKFRCTAGCPACEVHRAGLPMSWQGHTAECKKRLDRRIHSDPNQSNTCETNGTHHQTFGRFWNGESHQFQWIWSTQTRSRRGVAVGVVQWNGNFSR